MRVEFTYRLEDLQEALVPETRAEDPQGYRREIWVSLVGWIALIVLAGVWLIRTYFSAVSPIRGLPPAQTDGPTQNLLVELLTATAPASIVTLMLGLSLWNTWSRSHWRKPDRSSPGRDARRMRIVGIVSGVTTVLLFFAIWSVPSIPWYRFAWHPSQGELLAVRLAPWLLTFGILGVLGITRRQSQPRKLWLDNPGFARPGVVDLDDSGVRFADSVATYQFTWPMFVRARETPNLLLLVSENKLQWIIPKRAFPTQADLESVKALIQNMILNTGFRAKPIGFPLGPYP